MMIVILIIIIGCFICIFLNFLSLLADTSIITKHRKRAGFVRQLPPMGIFWDIENVRVPKMKSAAAVVQRIREVFLENYRESEFVVVCDVKKEPSQLIQELHDSQVCIAHV